ncbi:hypothetical protein CUMW_052410 [Citrus unshiu]|nr:hypothetical protein CUMW_052410 [Citrus unshiu]
MGGDSIKWLCILMILHRVNWVCGVCELSLMHNDNVYNYSLTSPLDKYPHGVLSEDGFYKVAVNQTVLWFQLCDGMIFNHDPPLCVDCLDCGGPSHCGLGCSALVEKSIGGAVTYAGYPVCTSLGHVSSTNITIRDKNHPNNGVIVKMTHSGPKYSCSLSVSVICDSNGLQGPQSMEKLGTCNYATEIRHPSGCATIIPAEGGGWGWFGTFVTVHFQTWIFGAAYYTECRTFLHHLFGDLEDLLRGIEAPILASTSEQLQAYSGIYNFCNISVFL